MCRNRWTMWISGCDVERVLYSVLHKLKRSRGIIRSPFCYWWWLVQLHTFRKHVHLIGISTVARIPVHIGARTKSYQWIAAQLWTHPKGVEPLLHHREIYNTHVLKKLSESRHRSELKLWQELKSYWSNTIQKFRLNHFHSGPALAGRQPEGLG